MVKKSTTKSSKKVVKEVTPVVDVPEPTPKKVVGESPLEFYDSKFEELHSKLKDALALIKSLTQEMNSLQKRVIKDQKVAAKKSSGRAKKPVDPNKPPSGFAKPGPISKELATFLNLPHDKQIARTEVTKMITEYCKAHKLQNESDKRVINPDSKLKKLLNVPKDEKLTFFNLQKFMKVHYPKVKVDA